MKNQKQILVGLAVVALLLYSGKKLYFSKKCTCTMSNNGLSSDESKTIPLTFKSNEDEKGNFTRFYMEDGIYFKSDVGPLIKTKPLKISKEDFEKAFYAA
jgi:hypothetical protein